MRNLNVCFDCFTEPFIKHLIRDNAVSDQCDFCNSRGAGTSAASWEEVTEFIREGLKSCWTTDTDDLPIDPFDVEGLPQMRSYDTRELLEGGSVTDGDPAVLTAIATEAVLDEIDKSIPARWYDRHVTKGEPYGTLLLQWSDFEYRVLRKSRFFFSAPMMGDPESFEPTQFPTVRILEELGELVVRTELIRIQPAGTGFFRARQHRPDVEIATAAELGPPSHSKALLPNRMSPAGIIMFYGARDRDTALLEVRVKKE